MRRLPFWAVMALTAAVAACDDDDSTGPSMTTLGSTAAWVNGQVRSITYNQDFFCRTPPSSGASSSCEVGEAATQRPDNQGRPIPILYVMTPIGFRPAEATLHCPTVGNCVAHPTTVDLSRLFGSSAANAQLPAHSHILDTEAGNQFTAFEIKVIGVTDPNVWNQIVANPTLSTVRSLQQRGQGITADVPSNLFLFFRVDPIQRQ